MEFKLSAEFIALDNLLKAGGAVGSGSDAKALIREGKVLVNGTPESRVRRKLRRGDRVTIEGLADFLLV